MKTILQVRSGSHLYGTNTPQSDIDYLGVFIPDKRYYYGLENIKELEEGVKSIGEDGKNNKDAVDYKLYELRHYCRLAMQNNPNMLEIIFANNENIIQCSEEGKVLRENAKLFPWQGCIARYFGYAVSQEKKMQIKVDNRNEIQLAIWRLEKQDPQKRVLDLDHPFQKKGNDHFKIGDMLIPVTCKVSQAINKYLQKRLTMASWRKEMWDNHGYDLKFASHLIRLLMQCKELIVNGEISFPIKNRDIIMQVRNGELTLEQVLNISDKLKEEIRLIEDNNKLPSKPRYDEINGMLMSIVEKHLQNS